MGYDRYDVTTTSLMNQIVSKLSQNAEETLANVFIQDSQTFIYVWIKSTDINSEFPKYGQISYIFNFQCHFRAFWQTYL
jgi:hypothetical protein